MIDTQTCKSCGEAKPLDAFERLPSGGYRGTCIACRQAAAAAHKRQATAARNACPEYQALKARLARDRQAAREAKEAAEAALRAERAALLEAQREAARCEREERQAAMRDDIWNAMRRGRAGRATAAVSSRPTPIHRVKLRHGQGYITVAELACRCAERDACFRAARECTTFEATAAAERILERPTPPLERTKELRPLWRGTPHPAAALHAINGDASGEDEADPFADALGDWGPAWLAPERAAWPALGTR